MQVFQQLIPDIKDYLTSEYPREGCGLIVGDNKGFLDFIPCKNAADDPRVNFQIPVSDKKHYAGRIAAIIHSHADGLRCPSLADMKAQIETGVVWGIARTEAGKCENLFWFGNQAPKLLLRGRPFRHGVTDCYALIRDWWMLVKNIELKDFPRDWEWWKSGKKNLYEESFSKAGFRKLRDNESPEIGDLCLMRLKSKVINHAGVMVSQSKILHHAGGIKEYDPERISLREPISRWQKFIKYWVRFDESLSII